MNSFPVLRLLVCASVLAFSVAHGNDVWQDLPTLPTARQEVGVTSLEGQIYVLGGLDAQRSPTGILERFDVADERWETLAPLPGKLQLHHLAVVSHRGLVYSIGGLNARFAGATTVFAYDPSTGTWSERASLPWPRGAGAAVSLGDHIYYAGGQDGSSSKAEAARYDPASDRWEEIDAMTHARNHLAGAELGGEFYAISGRDSAGLRGDIEIYDPKSRAWRFGSPIPTPRAGMTAARVAQRIFVLGGEGNRFRADGIFPQVEVFDSATDRWYRRPNMARPRHGIGAGVVEGRIFLPGGAPVQGFSVTDQHDALDPIERLDGLCTEFIRGDANRDHSVEISDAILILLALFGPEHLACEDAADSNDSGLVDISDAVFLLRYLFLGESPPPDPGAIRPGADPTVDGLSCLN